MQREPRRSRAMRSRFRHYFRACFARSLACPLPPPTPEYPFRVSYPSGLRSGKKFYNGAKLFFATNPDDEEGGFDGAVSTALGSAHAAPPSKIKRSFATPRAMQMGAPIGSYIDTLGPLEKPRQLPPSFWPVPSEIQQAPSGEVVVQGKASRGEELLAAIAGGNDDGSRAVQHHYCHRRRTGASTSLRLHGEFINALRPGHVIGALDARTDTWVDALVIKLITDAPAIRWLNVEGTIGRGGSPSQPILIAVQITFLLDGACTTIPLAYDLLRPARSKGLPPPPAASSAIDCIVAVRMNDSIDKRDIALDLLVERIPVRIEGEVDGGVRVSLRNVKKAAAAGVVAVAADGDGSSGGSGGGGGNLVTLNPSTCVVEGWRLRSSSDSTSTAYFSIVDELADKVAFVNLICNQKWALIPAPSPPVVRPGQKTLRGAKRGLKRGAKQPSKAPYALCTLTRLNPPPPQTHSSINHSSRQSPRLCSLAPAPPKRESTCSAPLSLKLCSSSTRNSRVS